MPLTSPSIASRPVRKTLFPTAALLGAVVTAGAVFSPFSAGSSVLAAGAQVRPAAVKAAAFRLESVVPKDALFFASIDDVPKFVESLKSTATFRTWLDPEVQAFFGEALRLVQTKLDAGRTRIESEIGVDLATLRSMVAGQAAVAVLAPGDSASRRPRILASLELGQNAERFREIARNAIDRVRAASDEAISIGSYTYEGVTVESLRLDDNEDVLHATVLGSALVLSSDEDSLNDVIEAATGGRSRDALAAEPRFRNVMARVRIEDGESAVAYADVAGAIAAFAPRIGGSERAVFDALGLTGVRAVGLATTLTKDGVFDTVFVDVPDEKRGILRLLEAPQGALRTVDSAPEGTLLYVGLRLDPNEVVSEIRRIAGAVDEKAAREMDRGLAEAREKLGFDPIDDLLAAFGDEFSFFLRAPRSGMIPDMAIVATLDDSDGLERSLGRIETLVREQVGDGAFRHTVEDVDGGGRLHSFAPNGAPFGVHLGIDGDTIVVGAQSATVRDALSGARGGLRNDPQFVSGLATLDVRPDSGVSSLAYVNLRDGLAYLYNLATPFVANWRPPTGVPFDMALLPSADALTRHMSPIVQVFRSEPGGFVARSVSPTGNSLVIYATIGAIILGY